MYWEHCFASIRLKTYIPEGSDTPDKDGGDENGEDEYENPTINEALVVPFETSITESFFSNGKLLKKNCQQKLD